MNLIAYNRDPQFADLKLPLDENRGIWAMWGVIATEASLFVCLFGAYFFLENNKQRWAVNTPPHEHWAFAMLAVVLLSGMVMWAGGRQVARGRFGAARLMLLITLLLGVVFLVLQSFDYASHWQTLTPWSNSYGSIFYAIETVDALHAFVGLLILLYVLVLPRYQPARRAPYRPYQVASLYWYFVVLVWVVIVGLLYVMPNVRIYGL